MSGDPYFCASKVWAAGSSPTDIAVFTAGNSGARIKKIYIASSISGGAAYVVRYAALKRSTGNTGGTLDSTTPSMPRNGVSIATSIMEVYTAAPTVGTLAGYLRNAPRSNAATGASDVALDFNSDVGNAINLHAGEKLYVNALGLSNTATSYLTIEWTEAP